MQGAHVWITQFYLQVTPYNLLGGLNRFCKNSSQPRHCQTDRRNSDLNGGAFVYNARKKNKQILMKTTFRVQCKEETS